MTEALDGIRFCWCPPMNDPDDPAQHEAMCAHAAFEEHLARLHAMPLASPFRTPPAPSGGCYEASFGWVHVKPDCRCSRRATP